MLNRYRDTGKGEVFLCILWWYTAGSTFICVRASLVSSFHLLYLLWIWKVWPHGFTWYFCIKLHLIKKIKLEMAVVLIVLFFLFVRLLFIIFLVAGHFAVLFHEACCCVSPSRLSSPLFPSFLGEPCCSALFLYQVSPSLSSQLGAFGDVPRRFLIVSASFLNSFFPSLKVLRGCPPAAVITSQGWVTKQVQFRNSSSQTGSAAWASSGALVGRAGLDVDAASWGRRIPHLPVFMWRGLRAASTKPCCKAWWWWCTSLFSKPLV